MLVNIHYTKQFRSKFRCRTYHIFSTNEKILNYSVRTIFGSASTKSYIAENFQCRQPFYMISRFIFNVASHEVVIKRGGPLVEYEQRIAAGKLADGDISQVGALKELQRLYDELVKNDRACRLEHVKPEKSRSFRNSSFWSYFTRQSSHSPVKGLYIYGGVGTGKTMLMDLFFDQLPCKWRKQRIHFHDFMLNVHIALQKHRSLEDPIEAVSLEICEKSILLCLDEFMVPDIAVAMILNRLFQHLFNNGAILVTTSNRAPENLYQGGLQRDLFLPFVATVKERCLIHEIGSSIDYRKLSLAGESRYFVGEDASSLLRRKFQLLLGKHIAFGQRISVVMGRKLQVPLGANRCAYFTFEELCNRPLGAADYSALFNNFDPLALEGVPIFGLHNRPAAYRFVTLVDVMYDCKAILLCAAEGTPVELFKNIVPISHVHNRSNSSSDLCVDNKLDFAKDRTISRLTEMNNKKYLDQWAARRVD